MSWTNAAVTEAGLALQAKLVDGQTLGFLRVAAGTGTVDPSVLANQTALANEKQTLTFQPPNVLDGAKIKVPVMLNNIGLETGYTMQQLGFFADDPDNGEILYAIVQDEVGDTVPSQTESPGFVIEWTFVFQYGNADSVTVTLDPAGLVSIGMVGQPNGVAGLDENGTVPVAQGGTGATTAQDAVVALGALFAIAAAAAYDPEGSYAVGDYCTHGGKLHKCGTAIPSGEAWNAEHWTATTVAAELAELRAPLANKAEWNGGFLQKVSILEWAENRGINAVNTHVSTNDTVTDMPYTSFWAVDFKSYPDGGWLELVATDIQIGKTWRNIKNWQQPWSGWIPTPIATPPQERNLTLQSGFSANSDCTFFVTQESAVFLAGGVSGTLPANQDTQIGTLPADAHPVAQRRRPAVTNVGAAYIDIHTDGTVWAHPFAAASQCWFDTSFVAGGS